jgi:hypothetical protein
MRPLSERALVESYLMLIRPHITQEMRSMLNSLGLIHEWVFHFGCVYVLHDAHEMLLE